MGTTGDDLRREEARSLWLHYAGAADPDPDAVLAIARRNVARRLAAGRRGQAAKWTTEWDQLLAGPVDRLLAVRTDRGEYAVAARQNMPFAGELTQQERARVLAAFYARRSPALT